MIKTKKQPTPAQDEIFQLIKGNPLTIPEIAEEIGKHPHPVAALIRKMGRRLPVKTLYLSMGTRTISKKGCTVYYSSDILGELNRKQMVYVLGDEILVGKKIVQNLPPETDKRMRSSITTRFVSRLPDKKVARVVRDYLKEHLVCSYPFDTEEYEVKITNPRGKFAHENFPESKYATDFVLPLGTPVLAVKEGEVVVAKHDSDRHFSSTEVKDLGKLERFSLVYRYTNFVGILYDYDILTEYVHLDKRGVVSKRQNVKEGEIIGYVGMSGRTDFPHLHYNASKEKRSILSRFV